MRCANHSANETYLDLSRSTNPTTTRTVHSSALNSATFDLKLRAMYRTPLRLVLIVRAIIWILPRKLAD